MAGLLFLKRNVLRFDLKESREGFCRRRGRGRSFHVVGPKIEKAREPTVESLMRGTWRLTVSEAERSVRDIHGLIMLPVQRTSTHPSPPTGNVKEYLQSAHIERKPKAQTTK